MRKLFFGLLLVAGCLIATKPLPAQVGGVSLMSRIARWRYPNASFHGAEMADGQTLNPKGGIEYPSVFLKTTMTTKDSVAQVLAFYKNKLQSGDGAEANGETTGESRKATSRRSVKFDDDSEGRPFAVHIISVNSEFVSTTIVVTRGEREAKTHIAWKQYIRLPIQCKANDAIERKPN